MNDLTPNSQICSEKVRSRKELKDLKAYFKSPSMSSKNSQNRDNQMQKNIKKNK